MKKWINNEKKETLQRVLFIGLLVLVFGVFILTLALVDNTPIDEPDPGPGTEVPGPEEPVVQDEKFINPIKLTEFNVVRKFYSVDASTEDQEMAVIQFGNKYFISRGISFALNDDSTFAVVSTMAGTVKSVTESPLYGMIIVIEHEENVITEYSSLSQVTVATGDKVTQGQVIGSSGVCEYDQNSKCHVHYKVSKNSKYYDPSLVVGKTAAEIA